MSAKLINLKRARKSVARADAAQKADENAARHGQSKATQRLQAAKTAKDSRDLDGHKRGLEYGLEHND
ncbi:MAG: DUF4169 family protein [Paracoccaceae bacterium]